MGQIVRDKSKYSRQNFRHQIPVPIFMLFQTSEEGSEIKDLKGTGPSRLIKRVLVDEPQYLKVFYFKKPGRHRQLARHPR